MVFTNTNYLDWYQVFVNEVSGSEIIFIFLSIIFIMYFCSVSRFPNNITLMILMVWIMFLSFFMLWLLPIVAAFVAIFIGWNVMRIWK